MLRKHIFCAVMLLQGILSFAGDYPIDTMRMRSATYLAWCSPEKLFVHLDRTYYAAGETIWFKGYLRNATKHSLLDPSNYIYAELLDSTGTVIVRTKIKRDGDGFPGHINLREELHSGFYTFRAYTLWQLNRSEDYFFSQKLKILGIGGQIRTQIPESDSLFMDFYPESGRYFYNHKAVVAFKATDGHGRSVNLFGCLSDGSDNRIPVVTSHDGMGSFTFTPEKGKEYFVELQNGKKFALTAPEEKGGSIKVRIRNGDVDVNAFALSCGTCTLIARNADKFLPLARIPDNGISYRISLPENFFIPGINHLLLVSQSGQIIAERLFYIFDKSMPDARFTASIDGGAHGPIKGKLELKDNSGVPLDANVSLAVVRGSFSRYIQDDNIVSYMGLSSELKGKINNPGYYFDRTVNERKRTADMDLLMLTQGWRYYDIEKLLDTASCSLSLHYKKEYTQEIKGRIKRVIGKKMPEKFIFSVLAPSMNFHRFVEVERANSFLIESLNFPENTPFLINVNRQGFGSDFIPTWSGENFAAPYIHKTAPGTSSDSSIVQRMPLFSEIVLLDTLQAAVVTADQSDIFGSGILSRKVSASDLETYSYQTLIQYLTMKYPAFEYNGEFMYNRNMGREGTHYAIDDAGDAVSFTEDESGHRGLVKVIEDGTEVTWWQFENIYLDEIEAISVSTHADSYHNAEGGLVAVKLRMGGKGMAQTRESLLYIVPLGYQTPQKFYNPRYDLGDPHESYDHRNTLYWEPQIKLRDGKAEIEFCDTDQQDYPYIVTVQGYTDKGQAVTLQCTIGDNL